VLEFGIIFLVVSLALLGLRWLLLGNNDDGPGPWTPWG
jgi:hypothetical protein